MITSAGLFDKSSLASLALKLSPQLSLLLQAYVVPVAPAGAPPSPPQEVFAWSRHTAQANAWYHIAIVSSGSELSLHVNGMVEASIHAATALDAAATGPPPLLQRCWPCCPKRCVRCEMSRLP